MTPQEEIKLIMVKNDINYAWIAKKLGTYYQKIQYYIELSSGDNNTLYNQIMTLFEKHGFIEGEKEKCENLIEMTFWANSRIGDDLRLMNRQISKDIEDGKLSPDERLSLRARLEEVKRDLNNAIEGLIEITHGEK